MVTVTRVGPALTELSPGVLHVMSGSLLLICLSAVHGASVCQWGRYGQHCELYCSEHCRRHPIRNLPPCHKDTGKCLEGCVRGRHGDLCDQLCSHNCINTTCIQPNGRCAHGCTDGYTGYFCNKSTAQSGTLCDSGQYGPNCDLHCSDHCGLLPETNHRPCHKDTGKCLKGCVRGLHGDLCDQLCSHNCINTTCNQPDGGCTLGCTDGYTGYFCKNTDTGKGHTTHSGHVMWMLPAIIFFFTTICCWRSGRCRRTCNRGCDWLTERILWSPWTGRNQGRRGPGPLPGVTRGETVTHDSRDPSQGGSETEPLLQVTNPTSSTHATPLQADHYLYYACRARDLEEVKRILAAGHTDINSRGRRSRTPVMEAAVWGHSDVVELLVCRGADVTLVTDGGDNILHCACMGGDRKTVEFVLSLDVVDVNSRGQGSVTPVMWAAWRGHSDVVGLLVSRRADLSLVDDVGNNILHLACMGGDRKTVEFVLSLYGVNVNGRNNNGRTAADVARIWRHHQLSDLLVSRGTQ